MAPLKHLVLNANSAKAIDVEYRDECSKAGIMREHRSIGRCVQVTRSTLRCHCINIEASCINSIKTNLDEQDGRL